MREVKYTTLSGQNLYNHAENKDSYGWSMRAAIDAKNTAKGLMDSGGPASRTEEFLNAAVAHKEAAAEHASLYKNATTGMKPTGGFSASPVHGSIETMYRNN